MPLTQFQARIAQLLAANRSEDSHLAGGAALHAQPGSLRYSQDLDYFHDSEVRVASAFVSDEKLLLENGYQVLKEMSQVGYIRCQLKKGKESTKVEWAHDSAWRFMPVQKDPNLGYVLHPIDLTINKILALAGRDEPRDYLDVHYTITNILSLGAQVWAACGKDPGFSPLSLLEILKRRGKYHAQDFSRLHLTHEVNLQKLKSEWLEALNQAESFIESAVLQKLEFGCLFYSKSKGTFVEPSSVNRGADLVAHSAQVGGVIPRMY